MRRAAGRAVVVFGLLLAACSRGSDERAPTAVLHPTPLPTVVTADSAPGQLVVTQRVGGRRAIAIVNSNGSGLQVLTDSSLEASMPAWSPDGERIAFSGFRDNVSGIYVMQADGSGLRRVTDGGGDAPARGDFFPVWSPNGAWLAFVRHQKDEFFDDGVWVVRPDGSELKQLTHSEMDDWITPGAWSPDSTRLVVETDRVGDEVVAMSDVSVIDVATGAIQVLTPPTGDWREPSWSPNGDMIVWSGGGMIWTMNADGAELRPLLRDPLIDQSGGYEPVWSPDGAQIAFGSSRDSVGDLSVYSMFIMDADGTRIHRLAPVPATIGGAAWAHDGQRMSVVAWRQEGEPAERVGSLIVTDLRGEHPVLVADDIVAEQRVPPSWRPGRHDALSSTNQPAGSPFDWQSIVPTIAPSMWSWGNAELYAVRPDGSERHRLTEYVPVDDEPDWSPDGSRIAFARSTDDYAQDILVMAPDGSGLTNLTNSPATEMSPDWSPDGQRIAYAGNAGGDLEIWLMDADGSHQTPVRANIADPSTVNEQPDWSPDGTRIVFVSGIPGEQDVWVVATDGSNARRLTDMPGDERDPVWSPDGTRIAFTWNERVWIMNADGTRLYSPLGERIGDMLGHQPAWSPDGGTLAFVAAGEHSPEVWLMNVDGTNRRQITDVPHADMQPAWSPDGAWIVFVSNRDPGYLTPP